MPGVFKNQVYFRVDREAILELFVKNFLGSLGANDTDSPRKFEINTDATDSMTAADGLPSNVALLLFQKVDDCETVRPIKHCVYQEIVPQNNAQYIIKNAGFTHLHMALVPNMNPFFIDDSWTRAWTFDHLTERAFVGNVVTPMSLDIVSDNTTIYSARNLCDLIA